MSAPFLILSNIELLYLKKLSRFWAFSAFLEIFKKLAIFQTAKKMQFYAFSGAVCLFVNYFPAKQVLGKSWFIDVFDNTEFSHFLVFFIYLNWSWFFVPAKTQLNEFITKMGDNSQEIFKTSPKEIRKLDHKCMPNNIQHSGKFIIFRWFCWAV